MKWILYFGFFLTVISMGICHANTDKALRHVLGEYISLKKDVRTKDLVKNLIKIAPDLKLSPAGTTTLTTSIEYYVSHRFGLEIGVTTTKEGLLQYCTVKAKGYSGYYRNLDRNIKKFAFSKTGWISVEGMTVERLLRKGKK